jgi:hypothetical protein
MRIDPETVALFRYTVIAEAANPRLRPSVPIAIPTGAGCG